VADDARIVSSPILLIRVDAEAGHEALVAQHVDGRLRRVEVEEADLGVLGGLSPSVAAAHWPISWPAWKLSVAKVASAASIGSSGVSSAITSSRRRAPS
jgi:hypothetical protein